MHALSTQHQHDDDRAVAATINSRRFQLLYQTSRLAGEDDELDATAFVSGH
jgi:hypothetical protein